MHHTNVLNYVTMTYELWNNSVINAGYSDLIFLTNFYVKNEYVLLNIC